jgi:hypothetical protein
VACARLPLELLNDDNSSGSSDSSGAVTRQPEAKSVLNVNTVICALAKVYENGGDWAAALQQTIPRSRGGVS